MKLVIQTAPPSPRGSGPSITLPDVSDVAVIFWLTVAFVASYLILATVRSVTTEGSTILNRFQTARRQHNKAQHDEQEETIQYLRRRLSQELKYREKHDEVLARHRYLFDLPASEGDVKLPIPPLYPSAAEEARVDTSESHLDFSSSGKSPEESEEDFLKRLIGGQHD